MNKTVFHRLIGAIIIGLLAIILLPVFFDGANVTNLMGEGFIIEDRVIDTEPEQSEEEGSVGSSELEASKAEPESRAIAVDDIREKIEQIEGLHKPVESPNQSTANASTDTASKPNTIALSELQKKALEKIEPAWSIRVATYFDKEIADVSMKKLSEAGYTVYFKTTERSTDGKTVYLVNVGPYMLESDAGYARKKINQLLKIDDSMLLQYIP